MLIIYGPSRLSHDDASLLVDQTLNVKNFRIINGHNETSFVVERLDFQKENRPSHFTFYNAANMMDKTIPPGRRIPRSLAISPVNLSYANCIQW